MNNRKYNINIYILKKWVRIQSQTVLFSYQFPNSIKTAIKASKMSDVKLRIEHGDTKYISVWGDKCVFTFRTDRNMQVDVHAQLRGLCTVIMYLVAWTVSKSCCQGLFHWHWPGFAYCPTLCLTDSDTPARWMSFHDWRLDCCPDLKDTDKEGGGSRRAHRPTLFFLFKHAITCRGQQVPHATNTWTGSHPQLCFILCGKNIFIFGRRCCALICWWVKWFGRAKIYLYLLLSAPLVQ